MKKYAYRNASKLLNSFVPKDYISKTLS